MQMPSASMCTYTSTPEKRELYLRATVHAQTDTYSYTPTVHSHTNQRHDVNVISGLGLRVIDAALDIG